MRARALILLASGSINWLIHLGGFGLLLVGIGDNSIIPMPGSMDVLLIWLVASNRHLWFYYMAMAVLGSLVGGYITYALAKKGGKEALEARFPKKKIEKVFRKFERSGFWAVAVPALLPPPFPIVPFLLAAGALQYSRRKFLIALAVGRGVRFMIVTGLGLIYGAWIVSFLGKYYKPALGVLIGMAVIAGAFALYQYLSYRKRMKGQPQGTRERQAA